MGYSATQRRALSVSVNGGAFDERDLLGVAYVIEQATKLRQPVSEVNPSSIAARRLWSRRRTRSAARATRATTR